MTLLFALLAFAAFRITRLVVVDEFFRRQREWLARNARRKVGEKLAYLVTCPFCTGAWVSAWLVLSVWLAGRSLPLPWLWWPAVAGAQAQLSLVDAALTSASH